MGEELKGEQYYQDESIAQEYDTKRFGSRGGKYIRRVEREAYLDLLGDVEGKTVLDVATGTGRLALDLAERGADVTGVDISQEMLDVAEQKAEERDLDITWEQMDAEDLDVDDDAFDIVTSQRFLHLVPDHQPYVQEMVRAAQEQIVYDYFNFWSLRLLYDWALPMGSYLHRPRAINTMLRDLGLTGVEERRRLIIPYGAMRNKSGPHVSAMIGFDQLCSSIPLLRRANSVVYVSGEL